MAVRTPPGFLRFDFPCRGESVEPLCFSDPEHIAAATTAAEVVPLLKEVERAVASGLYAAGYVSYDAAPAFDEKFRVPGQGPMPLAWFGFYRSRCAAPQLSRAPAELCGGEPTVLRRDYERCVEHLREAIGRGDSYQVNYTMRLRSVLDGDPYDLYRQLREAQRARYSAYLNLGRFHVASVSPELFFDWRDGLVITRPMKGTAPRGRWPAEDSIQAQTLAHSPKERAENITIVDLLRNDLSRMAVPGSVQVRDLCEVEQYPTVYQMISTVTARPKTEVGLADVFSALFPCGSVTGAPKISTMGLIADTESTPRQLYCGAIGIVTPDREAIFSVAIRTAIVDSMSSRVEYGVGGGVTWDSSPAGEYEEALLKAKVLTAPSPEFELLETILLQDGDYLLVERHLARLRGSAAYFHFPIDDAGIASALGTFRSAHPDGPWRVRLLVSCEGAARVDAAPFSPLPEEPLKVALAREPVDSGDRFLFHKTTHRAVYDYHRAAAGIPESGSYDVLLWNERGELTEFTTGNIIVELQKQRWTPPIESGLLAGTKRGELLDSGQIKERRLKLDDLNGAAKVWYVNSVRGIVESVLVRERAASPNCND